MSFIKIGHSCKGKILCTLCSGKPDSAEFFYTDDGGLCKQAKDPMVIEFNQENLKKIIDVFRLH